jgi:DNA-binding NarL/FixJ family response regulator
MNNYRAIILDDDQEFQISLSNALDHLDGNWRAHVFGQGNDALSFLSALNGKLDLALIDLGLPDIDGTKVVAEVKAAFPDTPILVVSVIKCQKKLRDALFSGATGYILKDDEVIDIAAGIHLVLKGHSPISAEIARTLVDLIPRPTISHSKTEFRLTKRETELLTYISEGMNYSEAACMMKLTTGTVHSYSRNLFRKLGVRSQRQAITVAQKNGVLPT